jgi:hypothetical protein
MRREWEIQSWRLGLTRASGFMRSWGWGVVVLVFGTLVFGVAAKVVAATVGSRVSRQLEGALDVAGTIGVLAIVFVVLWLVSWLRAPFTQRDAARRYLDHLERKPVVTLGAELKRYGSAWYLAVENQGPGMVDLRASLRVIGNPGKWKFTPVTFDGIKDMQWKAESGEPRSGRTGWRKFQPGERWYLAVADDGGGSTATLEDGTAGKGGKFIGADNGFYAPALSWVPISIQIFGEPSLGVAVTRPFTFTLPALKAGENYDEPLG